MTDTYAHPTPVSDLQIAFPANLGTLLPPLDVIPDDYPGKAEWEEFQHRWFFSGLSEDVEFHAVPGIDARDAYRHLSALQGSFEPQHEHKQAAVAWLASRWLARVP